MRESKLVILFVIACVPSTVVAQAPSTKPNIDDQNGPVYYSATLPTDRFLREEGGLRLDQRNDPWANLSVSEQDPLDPLPQSPSSGNRPEFKRLLRPRFAFQFEWEPEVGGLSLTSSDLSVQMPLYPVFGPPPPFVTVGYSYTDIQAPPEFDLPERLHDVSFGLAWMRRINKKWMARLMVNTAFASDLNNTSSDAWQVRAGGFALYRPSEQWTLAVGALATGRDDVPVIPALGAIWEPSPRWLVNLMLPNPRIATVLFESPRRQHWGYLGGGFSGGTWAFQRSNGVDDRLTYREWRLVLGWESTRPRAPGTFRPSGTKFNFEIGYVFGRKFEFDRSLPNLSVDEGWLLRTGVSF